MSGWVDYFPNAGYCSCKRNPSRNCEKCQKKQDAQEDWGVWEWRADGHYKSGTVLRVFTTKARARAFVDSHPGNVVVRSYRRKA